MSAVGGKVGTQRSPNERLGKKATSEHTNQLCAETLARFHEVIDSLGNENDSGKRPEGGK